MAVDKKVPYGEPGIAGFEMESWGNRDEWLYGDTPALVSTTITVAASGADVEIAFLDVLATDGDAAVYNATPGAATANYVAATSITIPDGETAEVPVYAMGHFRMEALGWDASYDTDAKKKAAFQGSVSPSIFVSSAPFNSDSIY
jgi:hypothetical protein